MSTSNRRHFRRALQLRFSGRHESNERGNSTLLTVHALQYMHKCTGVPTKHATYKIVRPIIYLYYFKGKVRCGQAGLGMDI